MEDRVKCLSKKVWRTKGARFNAHRRLQKRQSLFVWTTAITSIHLLVVPFIQLSDIVTISAADGKILNVITFALALVILIYSLIEGGKDYGLKSEQYHMCGVELGKLEDQLSLIKDDESFESKNSTYHVIIEKFMLNHLPIDDLVFVAKHQHEFPSYKTLHWFTKIRGFYSYHLANTVSALVVIVVPFCFTTHIILK